MPSSFSPARWRCRLVFFLLTGLTSALRVPAADPPDGAQLYQMHCSVCHQANGQGVPGVFPPLAASDFLTKSRDRAIRAPLEGLGGPITVNGTAYDGVMPVVALRDAEVAAVLTYVFTSWGNAVAPVSEEEVRTVRAKTRYPTFGSLAGAGYAPLPAAPPGWSLTEAVRLPFHPTRLARRPGAEAVWMLGERGDVWRWDPAAPAAEPVVTPADYQDPQYGSSMSTGMCFARDGRLYLTGNQTDPTRNPVESIVTVWRSQPLADGEETPKLSAWLTVRYPHGVGPFNHGVSAIVQAPDGFLMLSSGSRTDGGEPGKQADHYQGGEVPLTSCLWRLDPAAEKPEPAVWCRGLRNPYGLGFTPDGRLWSTDNGPDADLPEELNVLTEGAHYGFPFQFAHTAVAARPYPWTPEPPADFHPVLPVRNTGPDAGGTAAAPIGTFDPHSCPCGFVWLDGDAVPAADRGTFWITRFGNMIRNASGFDLVRVRPRPDPAGGFSAGVQVIATPLSRPIDLLEYSPGRLFLAEYSTGTTMEAGTSQPGRLLEFRVSGP